MSSTVDNSNIRGNILMLSTLIITLILPLILIILSYIDIISGTSEYIYAFAVITSMIYIIGGTIWMFTQDLKDSKQLFDG
ncbi:MAG: hypothetical protein H0A74_00265 [Candidatus Vesicomyosocius endoextente]|uniref:Uncharacterized protein n=1 Tax=Candidatus Vesicomyosocius endoextente TaxID=2738853 RepID=A0A853G7C1_9GAMM|nr:hypothetical protein [Candidatus Vesicomyosocius endoextente]